MAAECGMGLPNIEARDEPVPIIRLLVSGKGIAWSQNGGLLPSLFPVLQCSLCSVLCDKTPPQRGDGGGFLKEQAAIPTPLYSFFFFLTTNPSPLGFPPVSMAIMVQGEGLLAILSTDCLSSKSATVPSPGWRGAG